MDTIWINVWDRVLCRFVRRLVSKSVAKAIPHVIVGALACGPVTAHPPTPIIPPYPAIVTPPPVYVPTIPTWPVPPPEQRRWTFVPDLDVPAAQFIPSAFVPTDLEHADLEQFKHDDNFFHGAGQHDLPSALCDTPSDDKPPVSPVSAPGPLVWFGFAAFILFLLKAVGMQAGHAPVREPHSFVILSK